MIFGPNCLVLQWRQIHPSRNEWRFCIWQVPEWNISLLKEIVSSGFGKLIQKRRFVFVTLLIWVNAQQLLQGNIPLNHLLKEETAVKVVNDLTFSVDSYLFALNLPFFFCLQIYILFQNIICMCSITELQRITIWIWNGTIRD